MSKKLDLWLNEPYYFCICVCLYIYIYISYLTFFWLVVTYLQKYGVSRIWQSRSCCCFFIFGVCVFWYSQQVRRDVIYFISVFESDRFLQTPEEQQRTYRILCLFRDWVFNFGRTQSFPCSKPALSPKSDRII